VKEKRNKAHNSNSTIHRSDGAVVAQEFLGGFSRRTGKAKIPVRPVTNAFQLSHHFFFNKYPKTLYHDNPVRPVKEKVKKLTIQVVKSTGRTALSSRRSFWVVSAVGPGRRKSRSDR
jgi:hypothetical protein